MTYRSFTGSVLDPIPIRRCRAKRSTRMSGIHRSSARAYWMRGIHILFGVGLVGVVTVALAFPRLALAATLHLSTDPFTQATCAASSTTNHQTEVEPDTFANGSTIVAAFQVGRIFDGGACAIGFATSTNNGATWTSGLLPGITKWSGGGHNDRAT